MVLSQNATHASQFIAFIKTLSDMIRDQIGEFNISPFSKTHTLTWMLSAPDLQLHLRTMLTIKVCYDSRDSTFRCSIAGMKSTVDIVSLLNQDGLAKEIADIFTKCNSGRGSILFGQIVDILTRRFDSHLDETENPLITLLDTHRAEIKAISDQHLVETKALHAANASQCDALTMQLTQMKEQLKEQLKVQLQNASSSNSAPYSQWQDASCATGLQTAREEHLKEENKRLVTENTRLTEENELLKETCQLQRWQLDIAAGNATALNSIVSQVRCLTGTVGQLSNVVPPMPAEAINAAAKRAIAERHASADMALRRKLANASIAVNNAAEYTLRAEIRQAKVEQQTAAFHNLANMLVPVGDDASTATNIDREDLAGLAYGLIDPKIKSTAIQSYWST